MEYYATVRKDAFCSFCCKLGGSRNFIKWSKIEVNEQIPDDPTHIWCIRELVHKETMGNNGQDLMKTKYWTLTIWMLPSSAARKRWTGRTEVLGDKGGEGSRESCTLWWC